MNINTSNVHMNNDIAYVNKHDTVTLQVIRIIVNREILSLQIFIYKYCDNAVGAVWAVWPHKTVSSVSPNDKNDKARQVLDRCIISVLYFCLLAHWQWTHAPRDHYTTLWWYIHTGERWLNWYYTSRWNTGDILQLFINGWTFQFALHLKSYKRMAYESSVLCGWWWDI